jgi:hypothetical protein
MTKELVLYECSACRLVVEHDPRKSSIPDGWFVRLLHDDVYLFCHECGGDEHFRWGYSDYIKKVFKERFDTELD